MIGEPHNLLEKGLDALITTLRQDPHALETAHISVIAFAGRVKTLVPLIDVVTFYPPKLPIGSGTAIGLALDHIMTEIDKHVVSSTPDRKGDWKPVVFLMTDGKPTDGVEASAKRWKEKYAIKASIIAIGLGPYADTTTLSSFADEVLQYNGTSEEHFSKLIRWMSASVSSMSVAASTQSDKLPISLEKADGVLAPAGTTVNVDEDVAVILGRCQNNGKPYLIKYERMRDLTELPSGLEFSIPQQQQEQRHYKGVGIYSIDDSYFEWSDIQEGVQGKQVDMNDLIGGMSCPQCGNAYSMAICGCGGIFCVNGPGVQQCPHCKQQVNMQVADGDSPPLSINRSSG